MKDLQREILGQVASGQITAGEGAARLEALDSGPADPAPQLPPPPPAQPAVAGARLVKVISFLGNATIVGDPSVAFATAEGPHRARQDGDTLVIEHGAIEDGNDNFVFGGGRRVIVNGLDFQRRNLKVRMNPAVALLANVQAGNITVTGLTGPITGEVQAGNCRVDDFKGPLNLVVQAGNVTATGRLDSGASKIRCEMGSVKMTLESGSSVRITARSTMGKVAVDGGATTRMGSGDSMREVTIGGGAGTLEVDCTMGHVKVDAQ